MRFVIAMMQHETNTFSAQPTPYQAFAGGTGYDMPPQGDDARAAYQDSGFPIDAFLDFADGLNAEVVLPIAANADPSGAVDNDAFEKIANQICDAVALGCDAVLLDLHGAMVTQDLEDGEGELLKRIRAINADLPIAVTLDMHTNLTQEMVDNATIITGYRTNPHIDMYDAGMRTANTLLKTLEGKVVPKMVWQKRPMMPHLLKQASSEQPMKALLASAAQAEAQDEVLNATFFTGFPLADISHVSVSCLVVYDALVSTQKTIANALLDSVLDSAWQQREAFVYEAKSIADTIQSVKKLAQFPIVLADHGDNCGAGGNADSMAVIEEVIEQGLTQVVAGPIWDEEAVKAMIDAGVGAKVSLEIGGKSDVPSLQLIGKPLLIKGRVRSIHDGRFKLKGPMMPGFQADIGMSAVLDTGSLELIVSSKRCEPYDQAYLTHTGIDLTQKKYILIHSRLHFRAAFEPLAKHIVSVAGPGVCQSDYQLFPFKHLRRPIFPLDMC